MRVGEPFSPLFIAAFTATNVKLGDNRSFAFLSVRFSSRHSLLLYGKVSCRDAGDLSVRFSSRHSLLRGIAIDNFPIKKPFSPLFIAAFTATTLDAAKREAEASFSPLFIAAFTATSG